MQKSFVFIKEVFKGLCCFVLYIFLSVFITYFFHKIGISYEKNELLIRVVDMLVSVLVFFLIFRKSLIKDFKKTKENFKKDIPFATSLWLKGLIIMLITNFLINYFIFPNSISSNEENNRVLINMYPLYSAISVIFVAPFIEELIFRKSYRKAFKNIIPYCIASSILFGSIHVIFSITNIKELLYIIPYGALGYVFAYAYYKTDSIWTSIYMHVIHNAFTFLIISLI